MRQPTAAQITSAIRGKGYELFAQDDRYDLNLFGVRSRNTRTNVFDDWVGVVYRAGGEWLCYACPATTDPGTYWRLHPMSVAGTAVLKPGQYRGAYKVGHHKGYPALEQVGPVTVYRDPDRDAELDLKGAAEQTGVFGINIHRASSRRPSPAVDRWSAGCQVLQDPVHFAFIMQLAQAASAELGNSFTYTLLNELDLALRI